MDVFIKVCGVAVDKVRKPHFTISSLGERVVDLSEQRYQLLHGLGGTLEAATRGADVAAPISFAPLTSTAAQVS